MGREIMTVAITSGISIPVRIVSVGRVLVLKRTFRYVLSAPKSENTVRFTVHERKLGSIFFAIVPHKAPQSIRKRGEKESPEEPIASITNPAPIPHTTADFCESSIAIATTMPIIRLGTAGKKISCAKKAHCATASRKMTGENTRALLIKSWRPPSWPNEE